MNYDQRRKVRLDRVHLARLLRLPEGAEIICLEQCNDPVGINVVVVSDDFTAVDPASEAPFLHSIITVDGDGSATIEWTIS